MDDKRLRALLTAVQCGSFGKATAQLGYTQSAMTHMVNKLAAYSPQLIACWKHHSLG